MKYTVRVTRAANLDLDGIVGYLLHQEGPETTLRLLDQLLDAVATLSHMPERGSHPREFAALGLLVFRQLIHGPYRVVYRITGRAVDVVAILDGRRDTRTILERRFLQG